MVCDDTRIPEMRNIVRLVMKRRHRHRVHVVGVGTGASPAADQMWGGNCFSAGAPIALLFPGDVWAPDAVFQLSAAMSDGTVVYADEDSPQRTCANTSNLA